MAKTVKVKLAGREYTIAQKNNGPASAWRDHLNSSRTMLIFRELDNAMVQIMAVLESAAEWIDAEDAEGNIVKRQRGLGDVKTDQVINVGKILPVIVNGLSNSIDDIVDMVFDYSPEMKADREWIEQNAYDEELISVFVEVVKISFPFLEILALVRGGKATPISSNLPTANGASGRRNVGHRTKT